MAGINTGILHNAEPLSMDAIKELEKRVLEDNKAYAYLDHTGELCFAMQRGVDGIKDLAWNNAYELSNAGGALKKNAYKKTGHKTYVLDKTFTKADINAAWTLYPTATVERLEGDGQEFYTTAPSTLSFRSTAPLSEFQDVQINGQTIDPSNYTLEEGSTIVKLSHEYLKTLDVGSYELSVISDSKTAKGDFTVAAPELNEYGFYYNQPYSCEDIQVGEGLNECLINGAIVFNPDGTAYELNFEVPNCINTTLEHLEDGLYKFYLCGARITGRFSADGKTFIGTETFLEGDGDFIKDYIGPGINLALNTDVVAADDNGFYKNTYLNSSYDGMTMWPKPNNKQNYDNIRDNIDGIPVTTMASFGQSEVKNIVIPASILYINQSAFSRCENLENVTIPNSVVAIGVNAFWYCNKLYNIIFNGTVAQWNTINKGDSWHDHVPATYVQCSDGRAPL